LLLVLLGMLTLRLSSTANRAFVSWE